MVEDHVKNSTSEASVPNPQCLRCGGGCGKIPDLAPGTISGGRLVACAMLVFLLPLVLAIVLGMWSWSQWASATKTTIAVGVGLLGGAMVAKWATDRLTATKANDPSKTNACRSDSAKKDE